MNAKRKSKILLMKDIHKTYDFRISIHFLLLKKSVGNFVAKAENVLNYPEKS